MDLVSDFGNATNGRNVDSAMSSAALASYSGSAGTPSPVFRYTFLFREQSISTKLSAKVTLTKIQVTAAADLLMW